MRKFRLTTTSRVRASFFFRTTPLGFRQVVQHVRLHVAIIVNWLIEALAYAMQKQKASYVELAWTDT